MGVMSDDKTAILSDCQRAVADLNKAITRGLVIFQGGEHTKILNALTECESSVHLFEVNELFSLRRAIENGG